MSLMPSSIAGKIQFCESHLSTWMENSAAIGSSASEITALAAKTTAARAALTAQEEARDLAEVKTSELRDAVTAMAKATSDLVKKVRAKAATDGNTIYHLANIPGPATPAARGRPGTPTALVAELLPDGSLKLNFKCQNPPGSSGTVYHLYRSLTGNVGDYTYVIGSGVKWFIDDEVPVGAGKLFYQIQAVRSTLVGYFGEFVVKLGTAVEGGPTATSVEAAPKLAA